MKVLLFLRAENLPSGWRRKPLNKFAVISIVTGLGSVLGIKRRRFCITEIIPSTTEPEWTAISLEDHNCASGERIAVDIFQTREEQHNKLELKPHEKGYQGSEHRGNPIFISDAKHVASIVISIDEILQNPDWTLIHPIQESNGGKVIIHIEPEKKTVDSSQLCLQLCGKSFLLKQKMMEQCDMIYEILCKFQGQTEVQWRLVHRSMRKKAASKLLWDTDSIDVTKLCNQDLNRNLLIRVVGVDGSYRRILLGCFETNAHGLMAAICDERKFSDSLKNFILINDNGESVGEIIVCQAFIKNISYQENISVSSPISSLDILTTIDPIETSTPLVPPAAAPIAMIPSENQFFQTYVEKHSINLCLAIDFTASNLNFALPQSAHYRLRSGELNSYEWTIKVVGEYFQNICNTQEYTIWGFGGSFEGKTIPIFQCGSTPEAKGVAGLLDSYRHAFKTGVKPGNRSCKLDNIIMASAHFSKKQLDSAQQAGLLSYTLLVVLTLDGNENIIAAKDKIASIANAPISVLSIRIPAPTPSSAFPIDEVKLKTYLSNRNCRNFYSCIDGNKLLPERNSNQLSENIQRVLEEQMPTYFESQGVYL